MTKGTLILENKSSDIARFYINPVKGSINKGEICDADTFAAYDGLMFIVCGSRMSAKLIDENGKDITKKCSNYNGSWNHNRIPLNNEEIEDMAKEKASLFRKKNTELEARKLFCKLPQSSAQEGAIVVDMIKEAQSGGVTSDNFFTKMLKKLLGDAKDGYIGVDLFDDAEDVYAESEFSIEWEEKFDFGKLNFIKFYINSPTPDEESFFAKLDDMGGIYLFNAIVYDGTLYIGRTKLHIEISKILPGENFTFERMMLSDFMTNLK